MFTFTLPRTLVINMPYTLCVHLTSSLQLQHRKYPEAYSFASFKCIHSYELFASACAT